MRPWLATRLIALFLFFCQISWFGSIDYQHHFAHADLEAYRSMAWAAPNLAHDVTAPFCYRLLVPWLAGVGFPDHVDGFRFLTLFAMGGLCFQMYRMLRHGGSSPQLGLFLVLLLCLQPYLSGFVFFNFFQAADVLSLALLLVMVEALQRNTIAVLGMAMIPAVATREIALFIVPLVLMVGFVDREWKRMAMSLLVLLPGLALWLWMRWTIPHTNADYSTAQLFIDYAPDLLRPTVWFRVLVNATCPLAFIALARAGDFRDFARSHRDLIVLALLFFATTLVGGDKERLFAPAYVVLLFFVADMQRRRRLLQNEWFVWLLLGSAVLCSMHFMISKVPIPDKRVYYALCAVIDVVVAVAAFTLSDGTATTLSAAEHGAEDHRIAEQVMFSAPDAPPEIPQA